MVDATGYLLLGRSLPNRTVSLDVLIADNHPAMWVENAISLLAHTPHIQLRRVVVVPADRVDLPGRDLLFSRYAEICRARCDFLRPASSGFLSGTGAALISGDPDWEARLRADPSDVAVYLNEHPLKGACAGLARRGVWSLAFGGITANEAGFLFARDIMGRSEVMELCLVKHTTRWSHGSVLHRYATGKRQSLFYLYTATDPLTAVGSLIARKLHDLLESGSSDGRAATSGAELELRERRPSAVQLLQYIAGRARHRLLGSTLHSRRQKQWFIAWRGDTRQFTVNNSQFRTGGFRDFRGRPGMGYADPFPFVWRGRNLLFIEEILPDERGRLVVTELSDDGEPSGEPPAVILDKSYHLSYPFVFEHEGEHYLLPETSQNRSVELYRATRFPFDWELHGRLCEGLRFVDTTPLFHEGFWYFFVTTSEPERVATESFLYFAERLDGPWIYHPSNPVSSDARRSRSAGRLFWWNGRLIRPVQDCSLDYGIAVRLMAVDEFSPDAYSEREIAVIDCSWHPDAIRTHTLTFSDRLETIDGSRWVG